MKRPQWPPPLSSFLSFFLIAVATKCERLHFFVFLSFLLSPSTVTRPLRGDRKVIDGAQKGKEESLHGGQVVASWPHSDSLFSDSFYNLYAQH